MLEIQRGEVAGAPLFWTDQTPAPRTAGLVFRVGFADETLPTHGITHLVEHLALFPLGRRLAEFNGVVGPHVTSFFAQGEPDELVAFLRDVSTALHALPHDRVEAEKRVLLAESAGHQASFPDRMARMRWGETGPGLADVRELGLRRLGAEDLDRWAAEWFTLGNAAVWLDGPPPDGIELPLPPGERRPVAVAAAEPGPTFPAYERDGRGGLGMTLVGEGNGFSVATIVARQRLFDDLRRDRGLVYDVDAAFELLGAQGLATLSAACEDADAGPVRDALLATLHDLAEHGPTSEELEHEVEQTRRDLGDPRALEGAVAACAERELHGREFHTAAEALERTRAVTAEDCATQLAAALETALLVVPETLDADPPEGFEPWSVPKPEPARPEGRGFREKETSSCRHGRCEIVIGEGRLHWEAGDGEGEATVPLDRLLALRWTAGDTLSLVTSFGGGFHFCASAFDRDELLAGLASEIPGGLDRLEIPASEHVAAIDGAARERLPHVEAVTDELEALAEVLDRGEEPLLLAEAAGEGHPGLLAVTARRLVHLEPHAGVGRHQARAAAERRRGGRGGRGRRRRPAADPRGRRGRGHRRHPAARARGRGRRAGRAGPRRGLRGRRPRLAGRAQGSNPTPGGDEMPAGSNAKRERQYEHIKESVEERGASEKRAKEIAARTVNKERARAGEARTASRTSLEDKSSGERGGRRSGTDRPKGRTRDQLYNEARKMNIEGRSNMTKDQLRRAVDAKK